MQQSPIDDSGLLPPVNVSPIRSDSSINPFVQVESALQVELTRRGSEVLPLAGVLTLMKKSLRDNRFSEQSLHEFLTVACPRLYRIEKDSRGQWQVRSVKCDENRVVALLQLFKANNKTRLDPAIGQAMDEARTSVMSVKQEDRVKKPMLDVLQTSQVKVEGSTVEERVRARALLKDEQVLQFQREEKGNLNKEKEKWCVRIADVLQTYANSTVRRQAQFHPTEKCCMTLQDAVIRVHNQLSLKRRQIVDYLLEIRTLIPEWIVMDISDSEKITKTASVWLSPHVYRSVRHRLTKDTTPTKPMFAKPKSRLLTTKSVLETATPINETPSSGLPEKTPVAKSITTTAKRASPDPTDSVPRKKQRTELRINPNLIWTDADYDGGEAIPLTFFNSPRGLKRLFDQMKAGRRI